MKKSDNLSFRRRQRGVALVIILGFIVLLTGLVVAFFSRTMTDRQLSNNSFIQAKADQLALSAVDIVIGDLKQEIIAGSGTTTTTINGINTYRPQSNGLMRPTRDTLPSESTLNKIPNYIRRSTNAKFAILVNGATMVGIGGGASAVSSTTPSLNGRTITTSRWNKHYLIPKAVLDTDDSLPFSSYDSNFIPYWVTVTSGSGPKVITTGSSDMKSVIGRYAYAIYDEGGLLDINVAGYPSVTTNDHKNYKGSLAFADLTQIPTSTTGTLPQTQVDNIVGWRNYASANPGGTFRNFTFTSDTNYYTAVTTNTTGFLQTSGTLSGRSDQAFLSRQQLIAFQKSTQFSANALQYLTHFSRTVNAPSWAPRNNYTAPNYTYAKSGTTAYITGTTPVLNRDVLSVRVGGLAASGTNTLTIKHYDDYGKEIDYQALPGQPLLQRRFSLAKLNWLTYQGLSTDPKYSNLAAAVQACFGLQWNSTLGIWTYVGPTGSTAQAQIEDLETVAKENREPNFFELLQAGILAGSLAVDGGGSVNFPSTHQGKLTLQVLRIGACIIDQYDTDSYPTVIEYNESNLGAPYWQAVGVENLPYLSLFKDTAGFETGNTIVQMYFLFKLWSPNRTIAAVTPDTTTIPAIRLHLKGSFCISNEWGDPTTYKPKDGYNNTPSSKFLVDDAYEFPITGTNSVITGFSNPRYVQQKDLSSPPSAPWCTYAFPLVSGTQYFAYHLAGFVLNTDPNVHKANNITAFPTNPPQGKGYQTDTWDVVRNMFSYDTTNPFTLAMEFKNPAGQWVPYKFGTGINETTTQLQGSGHWLMQFKINAANSNNPALGDPLPVTDADWATAWDARRNGSSQGLTFTSANRMTSGGTYLTSDPRCLRFNLSQYDPFSDYGSLWPSTQPNGYGGGHSSTQGVTSIASAPYLSPNTDALFVSTPRGVQEVPRIFNDPTLASVNEGAYYYPAWLARNSGTNNKSANANNLISGYPDRDGVQRLADSGLYGTTLPWASGTSQGNPFENPADRPVILNRPFQSVAELGYVFRDDPWRTLDFFTSNSADAALLDFFSLVDEGPVSAGKINLNSRVAPCLQAAISGAMQEVVSGTALSQTDAKTLAQNLVTFTTASYGNAALLDSSQLATAFLAAASTATTATPKIKTTREAVIRGLAGVGQTRTWNLLVDVIAQSGRYGNAAIASGDLSKFTVEGERHYWAHIAIDRFTGEIVDMQLEPVNE